MTQPRFKALKVETKGGRTLVRLHDSVKGEELVVYRRGSRWLRWDARDTVVSNQSAQRVAREAMEKGVDSAQLTVEDCIVEAGTPA